MYGFSPAASNMLVALSVAVLMVSTAINTAEADRPTVVRTKRQLPPLQEGNQVIDDIFQVGFFCPLPPVQYAVIF